jgi:monofunctional biosynthetic peptidoglycan transglycosylase
VDERGHDREWGPADSEGSTDPTTRAAEPAREEPSTDGRPKPSEGIAPVPLALWPRAAGGGAGAVAALVVPKGACRPDELAFAPEMAPAEAAIEPPRPEVVPSREPTPPEPGSPDEAEPRRADEIRERASIGRLPHMAQPVLLTPQSQPLAVDPRGAAVPPLPGTELNLELVPVAPSLPLPQPSVPEQAQARIATPWPAPPSRPLPEAKSEAPRHLRHVLKLAGAGLLALIGAVLGLAILYRWVDPPTSTLMLGQRLAGAPVTQRWVPLERISPNLHLAVILSEDARFCRHSGVDWGELEEAIERTRDGVARGGSTISMQVVKNLFLWPSKSYVRKAIEIPLAYVIEAAWSKPRILEIYLNIAEWGPGVFGAEAAARHHFGKPASLLSPREAALLAVALPNPFEREAGSPGAGTRRLADNLLLRMRAARGNAACVRAGPVGG